MYFYALVVCSSESVFHSVRTKFLFFSPFSESSVILDSFSVCVHSKFVNNKCMFRSRARFERAKSIFDSKRSVRCRRHPSIGRCGVWPVLEGEWWVARCGGGTATTSPRVISVLPPPHTKWPLIVCLASFSAHSYTFVPRNASVCVSFFFTWLPRLPKLKLPIVGLAIECWAFSRRKPAEIVPIRETHTLLAAPLHLLTLTVRRLVAIGWKTVVFTRIFSLVHIVRGFSPTARVGNRTRRQSPRRHAIPLARVTILTTQNASGKILFQAIYTVHRTSYDVFVQRLGVFYVWVMSVHQSGSSVFKLSKFWCHLNLTHTVNRLIILLHP